MNLLILVKVEVEVEEVLPCVLQPEVKMKIKEGSVMV